MVPLNGQGEILLSYACCFPAHSTPERQQAYDNKEIAGTVPIGFVLPRRVRRGEDRVSSLRGGNGSLRPERLQLERPAECGRRLQRASCCAQGRDETPLGANRTESLRIGFLKI